VWEYGELFYMDMRFLSIAGRGAVMEPTVYALAVAGISRDVKISPDGDRVAIGPVWLSADTTMFGVLDSAAASPNPPYRVGPTTLIRLLNILGAKGWELVGVPSRSGEPYVFKRQLK